MIAGTSLSFGVGTNALPAPVIDQTGLPIGSELDEASVTNPRDHSEALRGRRSYMSNLGNLAFNSPYALGEAACKRTSVAPPVMSGPYGHAGRSASLRDFVRNVVVNQFAGAEPSAQILDAIVAYIEDIDFLPNPKLDPQALIERIKHSDVWADPGS